MRNIGGVFYQMDKLGKAATFYEKILAMNNRQLRELYC